VSHPSPPASTPHSAPYCYTLQSPFLSLALLLSISPPFFRRVSPDTYNAVLGRPTRPDRRLREYAGGREFAVPRDERGPVGILVDFGRGSSANSAELWMVGTVFLRCSWFRPGWWWASNMWEQFR